MEKSWENVSLAVCCIIRTCSMPPNTNLFTDVNQFT